MNWGKYFVKWDKEFVILDVLIPFKWKEIFWKVSYNKFEFRLIKPRQAYLF